jgi:hypothetical protein
MVVPEPPRWTRLLQSPKSRPSHSRSVSKIFVPTVFHRRRPSWMQAPWEQQSEDR